MGDKRFLYADTWEHLGTGERLARVEYHHPRVSFSFPF